MDAGNDRVESLEQLRTLYELPHERILRMKFPRLDSFMTRFIAASPLVFIATAGPEGLDNSPRGGAPGFVRVVDPDHVAIPDWPGNNKLESMTNILSSDGRCGLVFMVPYSDTFLRINGRAVLSRRTDLLESMAEAGRVPKLAILLAVQEAYFHCGKALRRSHIWQPEKWQTPELPSVGTMMKAVSDVAEVTAEMIDADYQRALRENLYG